MSYEIQQAKRDDGGFANYNYSVFKGGRVVARYWHDYRGEEHGIEFVSGGTEAWPVGRMIDFLHGGGPQPTSLSPEAISYLNRKLGT